MIELCGGPADGMEVGEPRGVCGVVPFLKEDGTYLAYYNWETDQWMGPIVRGRFAYEEK